MAVIVVPAGRLTGTGTLLVVLVPFPNWPKLLLPQASTVPVEVNARLWSPPPAMAVIVVPAGRSTGTGTLLSVLVPFPNWPEPLSTPGQPGTSRGGGQRRIRSRGLSERA